MKVVVNDVCILEDTTAYKGSVYLMLIEQLGIKEITPKNLSFLDATYESIVRKRDQIDVKSLVTVEKILYSEQFEKYKKKLEE